MLALQKELSQIFLKTIQQNAMPGQQMTASASRPLLLQKNAETGKTFSTINTLLLWQAAQEDEFTSPLWASAEHWKAQGEEICKGQQATRLYHFDDNKRTSLGWTTFVYNRCQLASCEQGKDYSPKLKALSTRVSEAKEFIQSTGAVIREREGPVNYLPASDIIQTPPLKSLFKKPTAEEQEYYYSQLLYPLMHWTGHAERCDRVKSARLFSKEHIFESLIALIGGTMLAARLEIRNANQIGGCDFSRALSEMMQQDEMFFINAASEADKVMEYLIAITSFALNAKNLVKDKRKMSSEQPYSMATQIIAIPQAPVPSYRA